MLHDKNRLVDLRFSTVPQSPEILFQTISSIGGKNGMFACNALWRFRAWVDHLVGGDSNRRLRSGSEPLALGDAVDFFRVERVETDHRLRLKTEMKLPGSAWLEFLMEGTPEGTVLHHAVIYEPKGFAGRVYWYLTYPAHALVFRGMHKGILREAMLRDTKPGFSPA